jgi:hypothetical protein
VPITPLFNNFCWLAMIIMTLLMLRHASRTHDFLDKGDALTAAVLAQRTRQHIAIVILSGVLLIFASQVYHWSKLRSLLWFTAGMTVLGCWLLFRAYQRSRTEGIRLKSDE